MFSLIRGLCITGALLSACLALAGELGVEQFLAATPDAQSEMLEKATPTERRWLMRAYKQAFEALVADVTSARTQAETDPLTGLSNRRALERYKKEFIRRRVQFVAISFDLDFFKKINDTYGHDIGDRVLKSVAEVARANTRDIVFRLGGEEFLIIVEGTNLVNGRVIAERLRESFTLIAYSDLPNLKVSASIGLAEGNSNNPLEVEAVIKASDEASYHAKQGGRNRVVEAPSHRICELLALP